MTETEIISSLMNQIDGLKEENQNLYKIIEQIHKDRNIKKKIRNDACDKILGLIQKIDNIILKKSS